MAKFYAQVRQGNVPDPLAPGGQRLTTWIPAQCIPLSLINQRFIQGRDNPRHPWNVQGLAWDLGVNSWRNMKNVTQYEQSMAEVEIPW